MKAYIFIGTRRDGKRVVRELLMPDREPSSARHPWGIRRWSPEKVFKALGLRPAEVRIKEPLQ